jgi:outer membrane lipoprotein SlyB
MNNGSRIVLAVAFLSCAGNASAQTSSGTTPATPTAAAKPCAACGTIQSIRYVEQKGQGSGAGAVVGGVVGGVVGHNGSVAAILRRRRRGGVCAVAGNGVENVA